MSTFKDLGLSSALLEAVEAQGFTQPTPVQEKAIPLALEGHDIVATAKTGTGKTAAFLLPSLDRVSRGGKKSAPRILVLSPTRELAQQSADACKNFTMQSRHRMLCVTGGTGYGPQISKLRRGVDVLIATPGRLQDLMDRGNVDLSHIEVLVLDEADRMLDMGFWPTMEAIVAATPTSRQTLLFSATIDRKILAHIKPILNNPEFVEIAHKGETADNVEQYIVPIRHTDKPQALAALLTQKGSDKSIVFMRTRRDTETCTQQLRDAGFRADSIHSDKSQRDRRRALDNFTSGKTSILVATDVLARGIDVSCVERVINYDLPDCAEDYVHRIGRTARAGEKGYAVSFISPAARRTLGNIEHLIGSKIPEIEIDGVQTLKGSKGSGNRNRKGSQGNFNRKSRSNSGQGRSAGSSKPYAKKSNGSSKSSSSNPGSGSKPFGSRRNDDASSTYAGKKKSGQSSYKRSDDTSSSYKGKQRAGQSSYKRSDDSSSYKGKKQSSQSSYKRNSNGSSSGRSAKPYADVSSYGRKKTAKKRTFA